MWRGCNLHYFMLKSFTLLAMNITDSLRDIWGNFKRNIDNYHIEYYKSLLFDNSIRDFRSTFNKIKWHSLSMLIIIFRTLSGS